MARAPKTPKPETPAAAAVADTPGKPDSSERARALTMGKKKD